MKSFIASLYNRLDGTMKEIVRGSSLAFALKIAGAGAGFIVNVIIARVLGAEGAGIYYLSLMIATIASVIGRIGLDNVMLRRISADATEKNWGDVKGVYRQGMVIALVVSSTAAVLVYLSAPWFAHQVFSKPELKIPLQWMALTIVPMALLNLQAQSLMALKKVRDSQIIQSISIPAINMLLIFSLASTWGVEGATWAYNVSAVITVFMGYWLWGKVTGSLGDNNNKIKYTKTLLRSGIPLLWVSLFLMATTWSATVALGIWGSGEDVGIYYIAAHTASLISFVLVAVNSVAAPKFSVFHSQGDMVALGSAAIQSTNFMMLVVSPALIVCFFFPGWIMGIFGDKFVAHGYVLTILAFGQAINVATGSVGVILTMSGQEKLLRNIVGVSAGVTFVATLLLVPVFGVAGAAISTSLGTIVLSLVATWHVNKLLGIRAHLFGPAAQRVKPG